MPCLEGVAARIKQNGWEFPILYYSDQCCKDHGLITKVFHTLKCQHDIDLVGKYYHNIHTTLPLCLASSSLLAYSLFYYYCSPPPRSSSSLLALYSPSAPPTPGLPKLRHPTEPGITVFASSPIIADNQLDLCYQKILEMPSHLRYIGFDCEWEVLSPSASGQGKVAVMQISLSTKETFVVQVLQLCQNGGFILKSLRSILEDSSIAKVGVHIAENAKKIKKDWDISVSCSLCFSRTRDCYIALPITRSSFFPSSL